MPPIAMPDHPRPHQRDEETEEERGHRHFAVRAAQLFGLWPIVGGFVGIVCTIVGATWYVRGAWSDVQDEQKTQAQTITRHADQINSVTAATQRNSQRIDKIDVDFAAIKQLLIDIQNGRKTDLGALPKMDYPAAGGGG